MAARCGPPAPQEVVIGKGSKQVLVDDPSGTPVDLFEPA
jgi:hypothetical protein